MIKEILLGNVAFAAHAVRRSTACPNQYWEPVLNEDGTQQLTEDGNAVCIPTEGAYEISCRPDGITVDIKYDLLYDTYDPETIADTLASEPAKLGNCAGGQEGTTLDYRFSLSYDQTNSEGQNCYTALKSGQSNEADPENTFINFIYEITGNDNAIVNEFGMYFGSKISFAVYCALPETFDLSNQHDVIVPDGDHNGFSSAVDAGSMALQFVLNRYTADWSAIDNDSASEIGAPTNFQVDANETLPSNIKYFMTDCQVDGLNDGGDSMSYVVQHDIDCLSPIVDTAHSDAQQITFNMFAYGHSDSALNSNVLKCRIHLCVDDGVVGCYQQYYQSSARQVSCNEGYEMRESPVLLGGVAFVAPEEVTEDVTEDDAQADETTVPEEQEATEENEEVVDETPDVAEVSEETEVTEEAESNDEPVEDEPVVEEQPEESEAVAEEPVAEETVTEDETAEPVASEETVEDVQAEETVDDSPVEEVPETNENQQESEVVPETEA